FDDPDAPPRLLLHLEATAAGCRWLTDRWAELGSLLDRGACWQSPDKLKAIRLLGHQPLDAADSEVVATIFQACHVLDPQDRFQAPTPTAAEERASLAEATRTLHAVLGRGGSAAAPEPEPVPFVDLNLPDEDEFDDDEEAEALAAWQRCGAAFTELLGE